MLRLVGQTLATAALIGGLLFGAAGTLRWPAAWAFLAVLALGSLALGAWLSRTDPALLRERLAPPIQAEQKRWDKLFVVAVAAGFVGWTVLMGVDARRHGWSEMPNALQAAGALGLIGCYLTTWRAFVANRHAATVVKTSQGQAVADTGPYRWVRHPMYAGALLWFAGMPLMLGSWWGLATAPALAVLLGVRAAAEERALMRELPGYAEYARRVRWRMAPGVW